MFRNIHLSILLHRDVLFKIVHAATYQNYRQHMPKVCANLVAEDETINREHLRNLFFGNYIEPDADPKYYDEVSISTKRIFQNV